MCVTREGYTYLDPIYNLTSYQKMLKFVLYEKLEYLQKFLTWIFIGTENIFDLRFIL